MLRLKAHARVRARVCARVHAHHGRGTCGLFTGAESERICVRKYDLVALRSFTNSSDLSGRGEREHTHSALFQLISRRNIADLCERACTRGRLRNSGNKNSLNDTRASRRIYVNIKDPAHVCPAFFFSLSLSHSSSSDVGGDGLSLELRRLTSLTLYGIYTRFS